MILRIVPDKITKNVLIHVPEKYGKEKFEKKMETSSEISLLSSEIYKKS